MGGDYGLFAGNDDAQIAARMTDGGEIEDLSFTLDDQIARFLSRWCHRALGDRHVAEQELRALIARAGQESR